MAKERLLSRYVKLLNHVTPNVVQLRDGSMFAMEQVDGVPVQTLETSLHRRLRRHLNHSITSLHHHRGLVLFDWTCRGLADPSIYPKGEFVTEFARRSDQRYRDKLFDGYLYLNRNYRGILLRPPRLAGEILTEEWEKVSSSRFRKALDERPEDRVDRLEQICDAQFSDLQEYRPRRLGWRLDDQGRLFTEIGEALMFAMTGVWRSVGVQAGLLMGQLFSERLIFGDEAIEIRGPAHSSYAVCYGGELLPERMLPGALDGFLAAPFRSTICNSFTVIPQQTALGLMGRNQNRKKGAGDRALSQIGHLDLAMDEVQSGRMGIGDHSLVITVFPEHLRSIPEVNRQAHALLSNAGFQVARDDIALEGAYASMLPGNADLRPRSGATTTFNFASLAAMHAFPPGDDHGPWGEPIALLRTTGGTPYKLHLHVNGVANAVGFGETGAGKTTFLAWLLAQAERLNVHCTVIDYFRGLEPAVRFLNGAYVDITNPTGINPLKGLENTSEDRHHLYRLYRALGVGDTNYEPTPEEERRLALGIRGIMTLPPKDRWLGDLCAFLGVSRTGLGARLEKYCHGKEFGWIIDNPEDRLRMDKRILAFDLTRYLNDPMVAGPVMMDILYRSNKRVAGRRFLRIIDEGWKAADIPAFEPDIIEHCKVDRKLNGAVIFFTQSVSDWLGSKMGKTLREQCPTVFGFAIKRVDRADLRALKFNDRECEIIEELQPGKGVFLIRQGDRSVPVHLPMHGLDDEIAVLSGNEENTELLNQLLAEMGDTDLKTLETRYHEQRRKVLV